MNMLSPAKLLKGFCKDTEKRCERNCPTNIDLSFLYELPSWCVGLGFTPQQGRKVQERILRIAENRVPRAKPTPFIYDPRVAELHFTDHLSIRKIRDRLKMTKAHVERCLREYRNAPDQLLFDFYREPQTPVQMEMPISGRRESR